MASNKKPEWKKYEDYICDWLKRNFPECTFKGNDYVKGIFSEINRQIDISIRGPLAGCEILGIVDCKYFSENVDIKVVDSFAGFLEDVNADIGIIITNKGYSDAAKSRAKGSRIRLEIFDFENLDKYVLLWDECQICSPGLDKPPALIDWDPSYGIKIDGIYYIVDFGRCNWCNSIHIKCQSCGVVTPIDEDDIDKFVECSGGCNLKFKVTRIYDRKGLFEDKLEITV